MIPAMIEQNRKRLLEKAQLIINSSIFLDNERDAWDAYKNALQDMDTTTANPVFPATPPEPTYPITVEQRSQRSAYLLDKTTLKGEYIATIAQLEAIEAATSPTNAQVIAAIKFLAKTLRLLLKLIARSI